MSRKIELVLPKQRVFAIAELLDLQAPRTCESIWQMLPIHETAFHCADGGREIFILTDPFKEFVGVENQTIYPLPGDIFFYYLVAGTQRFPLSYYKRGLADGYDIAIWYGGDSQAHFPMARAQFGGNHFARIVENLGGFARACEGLWRDGTGDLIVKKNEP
jgi:hypothetical protein